MTPDNFLFLEPLIKDALRARLDPRVFVLASAPSVRRNRLALLGAI